MAEMWYYTSEGKQMDPVSIKELKRLVSDGVLKPTDMVWKDGMPRWIRASSVQELYPDPTAKLDQYFSTPKGDKRPAGPTPAGSSSVQEAKASAGSAPPQADDEQEKSRPRVNRRRTPGNDADDDDERGSKNRPKGGSKVGIVLALLFGGGVLLAGLVVGVIILVMATRIPNQPPLARPALKNLPGDFTKVVTTFTLDLPPDNQRTKDHIKSRNVTLRRDVEYQITVTSEPRVNDKKPDVDLHVFNRNGQLVDEDTDEGPNSSLQFLAQDEGEYRIELRNLDKAIKVKSVVTIREPGEPAVIAKKEDDKDPPLPQDVKIGSSIVSGISLPPGQDHVFKVRVKKGVEASFNVITHPIKGQPKQPAFNHLFVLKENNDAVLAADTLPVARAQVTFMPQVTEVVRVRVVNTSKTAMARVSVSYNVGQ